MQKNSLVTLLALPIFFPAHACTTIIVGKEAARGGNTIIARTSDTKDARRAKNLQFYDDNQGIRSYIGLPYADLAKDNNNDMAQVVTNKFGVSMSATETIHSRTAALRLDYPTKEKNWSVSERNIPALAMPFAKTASHAVDIIGNIIEQRGVYGKSGFGVLIADAKEAWYLETLSGHQWVAIKIPSDVYFVAANGPGQIQEYSTDKYTYKLSNYKGKDPIAFAIEHGIANFKQGRFDFRASYGDVENSTNKKVNFVRLAYVQHYFNPEQHAFDRPTINTGEFPMFLKPAKKIAISDIKKLQASHYEDYPSYDPYLYPIKDKKLHPFYYPIANVRTSNGHITVVSNALNSNDYSIANLQYIALGMPGISFYLPIYYGLSIKPEAMTGAVNHADDKTLFWQFRKLQALTFLYDESKNINFAFNQRAAYVQSKYQDLAIEINKKRKAMEKRYSLNQDVRLINNFTKKIIEQLKQLNDSLINHFMLELDIEHNYPQSNNEERNRWFTDLIRQQDCNYRENHCQLHATPNTDGFEYSDEPVL